MAIRRQQFIPAVNDQLADSPSESQHAELTNGSLRKAAPIKVLDNLLRVTTPENISFEHELAGPFRRSVAFLLDVLVSICGYWLFAFLVYLLFVFAIAPIAATTGMSPIFQSLAELAIGLLLIGNFLVYWFYGALMETYFNGQTLGKRWTSMRVLSKDGHSIDGVQATLRNFFRLLDIAPIVSFAVIFQLDQPSSSGIPTCLFGLTVMTLSPCFQRVGDLIAGTVVISEARKRRPELAKFTDNRIPLLAELIPTSYVVSPSMARAIAEYVDKRRFLAQQRSAEIASYLAKPLMEKFGILPDTDPDLFICSLYYKTFIASQIPDEDLPPELLAPGGKLSRIALADSPESIGAIPVAAISQSFDPDDNEETP